MNKKQQQKKWDEDTSTFSSIIEDAVRQGWADGIDPRIIAAVLIHSGVYGMYVLEDNLTVARNLVAISMDNGLAQYLEGLDESS